MTSYWCELAWLGQGRAAAGVVLDVREGRFATVRAGVDEPPGGAERLAGLTLPGLANAHSHAFQRALRGRTQGGGGTFWTWREQMYRLAERLDPDSYRSLARAAYAEMALAGVTAVGEFHYLHHGAGGTPYADPNEMGHAAVAAARDVGIRISLLDACYLHGGIGEPLSAPQRRFSDGSAAAWVERVDALSQEDSALVGAAIHSVRAVDPASAEVVAAWAAARGRPLHAHVSEQRAENHACLEAYGRTPTQMLSDAGAFSSRFTAVHATHLDAVDESLLGAAAACCCVCRTTERDLADGTGRMRRVVDAGASLALGTDSHALVDLFEEARAVELDERLASGERGHHSAAALIHAASQGGHRCLGWTDAGRIAPGARADLVTVALDGVRLAGTQPEQALDAVVFAGSAADVRHVIVDGRQVVRDGRHVSLDVARELRDAIAGVAA
jgi:formiminoglutamate deiminase